MTKHEDLKSMNEVLNWYEESSFQANEVVYVLVAYNADTVFAINTLFPSLEEGDQYIDNNTNDDMIDITELWMIVQQRHGIELEITKVDGKVIFREINY